MPSGDFLILKWKIKEVVNGRSLATREIQDHSSV